MSHQLPQLAFGYDALEPWIDARTMEIHHSKHHQAYINNLNLALQDYPELAALSPVELIKNLAKVPEAIRGVVRNNGGGHVNHTWFWKMLAPAGSTSPSEELVSAIQSSFGNLDALKEAFGKAAATRFGSGWAWLCADESGKLFVCSTANQDNPLMGEIVGGCGHTPILGLDVWEHAYYLNYQNRRPDYIQAFWNVVNWDTVSKRFANRASGGCCGGCSH